MERITIKDKTFELIIKESSILKSVDKIALQIKEDYADKNPLFVVVLNGAFVFASDLLRHMTFPCQFAFTKFSSYEGTNSTGKIVEQLPVCENINGRHIIIVEDIVETGYSMKYLLSRLNEHEPASVEICALSYKPEKCMVPGLNVKYVGMTLPEAFIVGYGLDYDGEGRQLRDIYSLVNR